MNTFNDAIQYVKNGLDPYSVVSKYGFAEPKPGRNIRCPNQGHIQRGVTPPCSMNYDTGVWYCFGCGAEGDLLDFIGYALFLDYDHKNRGNKFKQIIEMLSGLNIEPAKRVLPTSQKTKIKLRLDPDKIIQWTNNLLENEMLLEWLSKRGIDYPAWHNLGFTGNDPDVLPQERNRLIIPHFYRGVLTAIKWRSIPGEEKEYRSFSGSCYIVPYGGDLLNYPQQEINVVESEYCKNYLYEQNIKNVVGIPNGMFKRFAHQFIMVRKVVHIQDRKNGEVLAMKLRQYLGARVKSIFAPDGANDPSEWAEKNNGVFPEWVLA